MGKKNKKNKSTIHDKKKHSGETGEDDELSINFSGFSKSSSNLIETVERASQHKLIRYSWVVLLILIIMIVSVVVRLGPVNLPITDVWASNAVDSNYLNMFEQQIRQERSNLPEASIARLTQESYQDYYSQNREEIDSLKESFSQQYKSQLQNENGMTYLLGIDEYLWYSYAKWYQRNNFFGTDVVDGQEKFLLRNGRFGQDARFIMHGFLINVVHDVWKPFNSDFNIEWASFYIAVVLIALSAVPLFFLTKRIGGTTGALIATILILTAIPLVGRTLAGSSDDDVLTIIFPFIMMAFLVNGIGKPVKFSAIMAGLAGLTTGVFMISWSGWWYGYLLVFGSAILYVVYEFLRSIFEKRKLSKANWIQNSSFLVVFFVVSLISAALIGPLSGVAPGKAVMNVVEAPVQPIRLALQLGAAAELGSGSYQYPLWPNVLRTVAELNPASVREIISGAGTVGNSGLLLFYLAILGIITLFLRYKEDPKYVFFGLILVIWIVGMIFIATSAVRFILMAAIPILISVGALIGYLTGPFATLVAKKTTIRKSVFVGVLSVILVFGLLWTPVSNARSVSEGAIPIFDDAWYRSIYAVKADAEQFDQRGIISSWWDYGHFFQAYGEQMVTFDGGDQGKRIYWMGRSLLTEDPDETLDILKVMNCGQEKPYDLLEDYIGDKFKATNIKLAITRMDREEAREYLLQFLDSSKADEVLALSHCDDLHPMYFVTSEDMVGKAPVWAHFGGWNFTKAYFYYYLKNLPITEVYDMESELNMSQEQIRSLYNEARLLRNEASATEWISPFVSYSTRETVPCVESNATLICDYNLALQQNQMNTLLLRRIIIPLDDLDNVQILLQTINSGTGTPVGQDILKPNNLVFENNGVLRTVSFSEDVIGFDVVLMFDGTTYSSLLSAPELSKSVFTRLFFMDGRGEDMAMFEKISDITSFRGERIIIWKVNP